MNFPMDEPGVPGRDTTLCSDRWYPGSFYDRQQFEQKYIGVPLNELLRYGEPNWSLWEGQGRNRIDFYDSLDSQDRLDND